MKYAVMSDVHVNPVALAKAVDDARTCGVEAFVCLGDIVGYGPSLDEAKKMSKYPRDLDEAYMIVSKDGIKWTWGAYSILLGCYGTPSVFIKWEELEAFK